MKLRLPALFLLALTPLLCVGGVNPRNGNFFITYQDTAPASDGPALLDWRRTYNSKAAYPGWVGYGWSTVFETYLVLLPDGSGVVRENGSGANTWYRNADEAEIQRGALRLARDAIAPEKRGTPEEEALRDKLLDDEDLRARTAERVGQRYEIPVGRAVQGNRCPKALLRATGTDYRRTGCEGETDVFDLQGRLLRRTFDDGRSLELVRTDGKVTQVRDHRGQSLQLHWGSNGKIERLVAPTGKTIRYGYDAAGNLAESEDDRGNLYKYRYDGRHNLLRIDYIDTSYMAIDYVSEDSAMASRVLERDGSSTRYEYGTDARDPRRSWTVMTSVNTSGLESTRRFEYQDTESATGTRHAESVPRQGASRHADSLRTRTRLDARARPVERLAADGQLTRYEYDERCNKPSRVTTTADGETDFTYNRECNLARIASRDGQEMRLAYDARENMSRIWSRQDENARPKDLRLSYDSRGKPTSIHLQGAGTIRVTWSDAGEVEEVTSPKGAKMSLAVMQVFHELLSSVKRAQAAAGF